MANLSEWMILPVQHGLFRLERTPVQLGHRMNDERSVAEVIEANVRSLLSNARLMASSKQYAVACHLAVIAIEEFSKFIIIYTRNHCDPNLFRRRFSHLTKQEISSLPWAIVGRFAVIHAWKVKSTVANSLGVRAEALHKIARDAEGEDFKGDPQSIANMLVEALDHSAQMPTQDMHIGEMEVARTKSVYVDVADDGEVIGGPEYFEEADAQHWIESAAVCLGIIEFVRQINGLTIEQFPDLLPPGERARFLERSKRYADENLARMMAQGGVC